MVGIKKIERIAIIRKKNTIFVKKKIYIINLQKEIKL